MKFIQMLSMLLEGGNVTIDTGKTLYYNKKTKKFQNEFIADFITIGTKNKVSEKKVVFQANKILELIKVINASYLKFAKENLWENIPEQTSGEIWENFKHYFSGSTYHFMGLLDTPINIPDFYLVKKKLGDIDIKVNLQKQNKIKSWLKRKAKKDFPITGIKFWTIDLKKISNEQLEILNSIKNDTLKQTFIIPKTNTNYFIPNNKNNNNWELLRKEVILLKQKGIIKRYYEILPNKDFHSSFWFMGFNPSNEQDITLWSIPKNSKQDKVTNERINIQMDFEYMDLGLIEKPAEKAEDIPYIGKIVGNPDFYAGKLGKYTMNGKEVIVNYPGVHKAKSLEAFTTGNFIYKDFFVIKKKGIEKLQALSQMLKKNKKSIGEMPLLDDKKSFEIRNERREWVLGADAGLRKDYELFDLKSAKILEISDEIYNTFIQSIGAEQVFLDFDILKKISMTKRDDIFKRLIKVKDVEETLNLPRSSLANFSVILPHIIDNIKNGNEVIKNKKQIIEYIKKMNERSLQFRNKEESVIKKLPGFLLLKRELTESNNIDEKWLLDISLYLLQKESKDLERSIKLNKEDNANKQYLSEVDKSLLDIDNLNKALKSNFKVSGILQWKNLEQLKNNINDENNREKVLKDILSDKTLTFFPKLTIKRIRNGLLKTNIIRK